MFTNQLITVCKNLKLSSIASYAPAACEQARRQQQSYEEFLFELINQEYEERLERRIKKRIKEAKFPKIKTLDSFDFNRESAAHLPETFIRSLSEGHYIKEAQSIILLGEPGTGKTHIACALGYSAAQQGKTVRFITSSQLVNQLMEAKDSRELHRITQQYQTYQVLIVDELGYLPFANTDAELLFQVLSTRHEQASTIITTNLPFSEWTSIFLDHRLCKALIDRLTHKAHIIDTGELSNRFMEAIAKFNESKNQEKK